MLLVLLFSSLRWSVQGISLPTQYTVQVHTLNTDATGGVSTAESTNWVDADAGKQRINTTVDDSKQVLVAEVTLPQPAPNPGPPGSPCYYVSYGSDWSHPQMCSQHPVNPVVSAFAWAVNATNAGTAPCQGGAGSCDVYIQTTTSIPPDPPSSDTLTLFVAAGSRSDSTPTPIAINGELRTKMGNGRISVVTFNQTFTRFASGPAAVPASMFDVPSICSSFA
eukprot:gene5820-2522_t